MEFRVKRVMFLTLLMPVVWSVVATPSKPDDMSARGQKISHSLTVLLHGMSKVCPMSNQDQQDPRWICISSPLGLDQLENLVSQATLANGVLSGLKQTDPWDDDAGTHLSFADSSLYSVNIFVENHLRVLVLHEIRP